MSGTGSMELDYDLVNEDEFDALCLDVKKTGLKKSDKYPAKLHARKVAKELGVDDGIIYLPGEPTRIYEDSDMGPAFRQRRYFYYITGANFADCAVTYELGHDRLTLWIPYVEPRQVLWFGSTPDAARAMALYDVDDVRYTTQLPKFLHAHLRPATTLFILHPDQAPRLMDRPRAQTILDYVRLRPAMDAARVVKSDFEVAMIKRANDVSSAAHRVVAERLLTLRNEQDVEALHLAVCTARGAHSQAYAPIAGAGANASTLHYGANDQPLRGKQLLVVDAGCEWDCYASDITRTLPIAGSFSREAGAVHAAVQRMQDECIEMVAPGRVFAEVHLHAAAVAVEELLKLGILKGDREDVLRAGTVTAFFPHGLGHHVGLECHDVDGTRMGEALVGAGGRMDGGKREMVTPLTLGRMMRAADAPRRPALKPNMIVTVEPGIYFCREYIEGYFLGSETHRPFIDTEVLERYYDVGGVRIEDCILVTEDGYENLTTAPKGDELLDVINGGFEHI